jgi:GNAT superfamily N-acetyltransferase
MSDARVDFVVRAAAPVDAERILRMHVDSIRRICSSSYTSVQIDAWTGSKRAEHYVRAMEAGEAVFVAESAGHLLGFAALRGDCILAVYVSADHQRRGIGAALLAALEDNARLRRVAELHLESTLNAVNFYTSRGYLLIQPSIRVMHGVDVPCVKMSKQLD